MIPQLLSPAGSFDCLSAALQNGADAVYFGIGRLNMRGHATANFQPEDLPEIVRRCHNCGVQAWLTLNTLIYNGELPDVELICRTAAEAGVDAVIAADPAAILSARRHRLSVHLSVQANICNTVSLRYYSQFADVAVLARELSLEQIKEICTAVREEQICGPSGEPVKIEVFAHGALCMAVSGQCYMSLATYNTAASRGECYQNCRRRYQIRDAEAGTEFALEDRYVLSPRDLCTLEIIDRLADAGVSVLKIEGRGRSADYVAHTTRVYREALDFLASGREVTFEQKQQWKKSLEEVFNRGFWNGGYYLGEPVEKWGLDSHNQATLQKEHLGFVTKYFAKAGVAELQLNCGSLSEGDRLLITGPTTGALELTAPEVFLDEHPVAAAAKGSRPTIRISQRVRPNDQLFKLKEMRHEQRRSAQ